jgi:hypothetical protein
MRHIVHVITSEQMQEFTEANYCRALSPEELADVPIAVSGTTTPSSTTPPSGG